MNSVEQLVEDASTEEVQEFFSRVGLSSKSYEPTDDRDVEGPLGRSMEIAVFQARESQDQETEGLEHGLQVRDTLSRIFLSDIERITLSEYLDALAMCCYGHIFGNLDEEDLRYVYRYSLGKLPHQKVDPFVRKALLLIEISAGKNVDKVISGLRDWIAYMGTPYWKPQDFSKAASELGLNLEPILESEKLRLTDSIRRYPEYLEEALRGKDYFDVYTATHVWLPDVLSSRILGIFRENVNKEAQEKLDSDADVSDAYKAVERVYKKRRFMGAKGRILPIRLQDLPSPPPPEAIEPVVFEMIPQKLRVELMPSVAYSGKAKQVEIIFLGGPDIGRSGILIRTDTSALLLDYGLSVTNQRIPDWVPELEMIDCVLVTHSHLDHVGGLPTLYEDYSGKWCATGVTGAVSMTLLEDALKVGTPLPPRRNDQHDMVSRFNRTNIDKVKKNYVQLEAGTASELAGGMVVTPVEARHIPGSSAYVVDIEGTRILYTGDFNVDDSVLFHGANLPTDCDVVIFDGTYWGRDDFNRKEVSEQVSQTVAKHGPVIIPTFAVGRSQEMLVMLDELGITSSRNVIAAGMAERVTKLTGYSGQWTGMKKNKVVLDEDDVLVAGGGMLDGGFAKMHYEEHRHNPNAAVILCGYLAPRTTGWNLLNGYETHKCAVEYARLSAHSSASSLAEFVDSCSGKKVMVHTPTKKASGNILLPEYRERVVLDV
ncbi:MBL fold metallo-hydrolase [Candidatus Thorarchaeota archaeon]|nr:MAG: MBL fold metallo-hydrolase [Candidatus Thorarchaeota archaeon]